MSSPSKVYSDPNPVREELAQKKIRLAQIKLQYHGWAVFALTKIINQLIIDPIQTKMEGAHYSRKIIERTYLAKNVEGKGGGRTVTFHVKSDYISETGFPVAVMMERGRKAYTVKAKEDRPRAHLKMIIDGKTIYRKSVKIPRKEGSKIITDIIRSNKHNVNDTFKQEQKEWMNGILKS